MPVAIIGLFAVRGLAGFIAQYGLAWAAIRGMMVLRAAMFERLMNAQPALFTRESASSLTNTLTYEVAVRRHAAGEFGADTGARIRSRLLALLGYLL